MMTHDDADGGVRKFTGRDFALIFLSVFAVVTAVNITMIVLSVKSFPGVDVKNGYEESQVFDQERTAQQELGWQSTIAYEDGTLVLDLVDKQGRAVSPNSINVKVGRPSTDREDRDLQFSFNGRQFVAEHELEDGQWMALVEADAPNGTYFHQVHKFCLNCVAEAIIKEEDAHE